MKIEVLDKDTLTVFENISYLFDDGAIHLGRKVL